ncbi:MAG TPA: ATP-binding protein [Allosphingosinicella sp.]
MQNVTPTQLQNLLEGMNVGLILLDPDFRVRRVNAETMRVDGRSMSDVVGKTFWEAWPGVADAAIGHLVRHSMRTRTTEVVSQHFVSFKGQETWLEMRVHPWGEGVAVFFRDVSERRRALAELEATQERYRLTARATHDVVWDWNIVTDKVRWDGAAFALLGSNDGEPLTTQIGWWENRIHDDDRDRVVASLRRSLENGAGYWAEEYRLLAADGDYVIVYDRGFIIRDAAGRAVRAVGAMVDVTEVRKAELKVQQLQSQLIHVSRLSAMGTMASTLAHELNQPLTAVTSYVSGCQRIIEGREDEETRRLRDGLQGARESALRAGDVIRRLRAMIERGEVQRRRVNLLNVVQEAAGLGLVGLTDEVSVSIDIASGLIVDADPIQLQQVVLNLIRNALEAMEASPRKRLRITGRRQSKAVRLEVGDTGGGISAAIKESLFDPFVSTRESGMGIGLSISRTIIEAHLGRIWAEDNEGGGTVFCITLPAAKPKPRL